MRIRRTYTLPILKQVGPTIRAFRKAHGLTQAEVAERAGMTPEAICRIETGAVLPDLSTLPRLGEVLGVSPAALLREPTHPPPVGALVGWSSLSDRDRALVRKLVARLVANDDSAR